ncbi:unnamed protein product [Polarella glacialis]|uniref:Pentatricopeptide repeat-containing protein n=1 Tax=Polarella glacialis TaxID=89957 RepID=A0A813H057_POLGL|nr:unnamed protein product [Polarella glacialis]CAE8686028.1 unnamed protein product [Polarella glacialis]
MPTESVLPNEITYSAAISACSKGSQWQLALNLLRLMPVASVVPNEISYSANVSACSKCTFPKQQKQQPRGLRGQGSAPRSGLCSERHTDTVERLLREVSVVHCCWVPINS